MDMEEDRDLEFLKTKKMLELRKRLSHPPPREKTPRDMVLERLTDRGDEVLVAAEGMYPKETAMVVSKLAELIKSGVLKGFISGGELLWLFRSIGLRVRVPTKIMVEKKGKLITLMEKLKAGE